MTPALLSSIAVVLVWLGVATVEQIVPSASKATVSQLIFIGQLLISLVT